MGLSGKPASTLAFSFNPMLSVPKEEFVSQLTQDIPPPPVDMASTVAANLRGSAAAAATA